VKAIAADVDKRSRRREPASVTGQARRLIDDARDAQRDDGKAQKS
jgi:hypothetical protein